MWKSSFLVGHFSSYSKITHVGLKAGFHSRNYPEDWIGQVMPTFRPRVNLIHRISRYCRGKDFKICALRQTFGICA